MKFSGGERCSEEVGRVRLEQPFCRRHRVGRTQTRMAFVPDKPRDEEA